MDCGHNELTVTACGDPSRFCAKCLPAHATGKKYKKPVIARPAHIELDEDGNPLPFNETKRGLAYQILVKHAIHKLGTKAEPRVTIGQIKRFLGDRYDDDNTLTTLSALEGARQIEYRQKGEFWSWVDTTPPVKKQLVYNNTAVFGARV